MLRPGGTCLRLLEDSEQELGEQDRQPARSRDLWCPPQMLDKATRVALSCILKTRHVEDISGARRQDIPTLQTVISHAQARQREKATQVVARIEEARAVLRVEPRSARR